MHTSLTTCRTSVGYTSDDDTLARHRFYVCICNLDTILRNSQFRNQLDYPVHPLKPTVRIFTKTVRKAPIPHIQPTPIEAPYSVRIKIDIKPSSAVAPMQPPKKVADILRLAERYNRCRRGPPISNSRSGQDLTAEAGVTFIG